MGKLFGTDGVRGVAGKDLTCELALQIGRGTVAETPVLGAQDFAALQRLDF